MVSAVKALCKVHLVLLVLIVGVRVVEDALGAAIASGGGSYRARLLEVHRHGSGSNCRNGPVSTAMASIVRHTEPAHVRRVLGGTRDMAAQSARITGSPRISSR